MNDYRSDFPILQTEINGKRLVYLDSASTTQKPACVIDAISSYYKEMNANTHRGVHTLSERATEAYEGVREQVARFINAGSSQEIIFTRGTTESLNLIAYTYGEQNIVQGDEIVITALEHHANLVPWQQLCKKKGAKLKVIPINKDGSLDELNLDEFISDRAKIVAVTAMSNVLGTIVPLKPIIERAKQVGAITIIDAAQSAGHLGVDVKDLDCDFLAFSAHKMCGPTGVGVLYGREELLEQMPPFNLGGEMIKEVKIEDSVWHDLPWKFEAGTQNIADVIAFGEAIKYLEKVGMENIRKHDEELLVYAREKLAALPDIELYGPKTGAGSILSFNIPGVHAHDVGSIVNEEGVAIRTGHHCAQPLVESLGQSATARMSFYFYNTKEEIDLAVAALQKVYKIFK
ncbi:cysteine desulfurase [Pseudomonadota bacterium]